MVLYLCLPQLPAGNQGSDLRKLMSSFTLCVSQKREGAFILDKGQVTLSFVSIPPTRTWEDGKNYILMAWKPFPTERSERGCLEGYITQWPNKDTVSGFCPHDSAVSRVLVMMQRHGTHLFLSGRKTISTETKTPTSELGSQQSLKTGHTLLLWFVLDSNN